MDRFAGEEEVWPEAVLVYQQHDRKLRASFEGRDATVCPGKQLLEGVPEILKRLTGKRPKKLPKAKVTVRRRSETWIEIVKVEAVGGS